MNIFYLDYDPKLAALFALDKHCIKMILESVQLLYTCYHLTDPEKLEECPYIPYKITHKNHPCSVWLRKSLYHYFWLMELGWWYCKEYTFRYNKVHACEKHLVWLITNPPNLPIFPFEQPPQAMPDKYKCEDSVEAYRKYYIGEKLRFAKYTKREAPNWLKDYI
jgi:hypothetical protein